MKLHGQFAKYARSIYETARSIYETAQLFLNTHERFETASVFAGLANINNCFTLIEKV